MATDEDTNPDSEAAQLERAREEARLHRRLQQQGEEVPDESVPPRERERHAAIDHAVEDVERSVRHASERRVDSTRDDAT